MNKLTAVRKFSIPPSVSYRLFYPQVPSVLCAKQGRDLAAMPANSCMPISNSPAMIGVSVRTGSKTEEVLSRAKNFSLSWLGYSKESIESITKLADKVLDSPDKLKTCGISYLMVSQIPVLAEAVAFVICRIASSYRFGDHVLFVGRIRSAKATKDFTNEMYWRFEKYRPILYLGSNRKNRFTTL